MGADPIIRENSLRMQWGGQLSAGHVQMTTEPAKTGLVKSYLCPCQVEPEEC